MKKRKKKKKSTLKNAIKLVGFVATMVGIVAFFLDFFGIWDIGKKFPAIYSNEISVTYLSTTDSRKDNIYQLFDDEIDDSKKYQLSDSCATQIYISNYYEQEIVLNSIRFVAEDISLIEEPILSLNAMEGEGYVDLRVLNAGWENSKNLELKFYGVNDDLANHFVEEKLLLSIPGIKSGECKTFRLWENSDVVTEIDNGAISFTATCHDIDGNEIDVIYNEGDSQYLSIDIYNGELLPMGKGGPSDRMYGVCIDTSKSSFSYQDSIEEYIQPNETLTLPICFYPDKSCSMTFYVEFTAVYGNDEIVIQSDPVTLTFEVLNVDYTGIFDATQYSRYDLEKFVSDQIGECLVSYPFIEEGNVQVEDKLLQ